MHVKMVSASDLDVLNRLYGQLDHQKADKEVLAAKFGEISKNPNYLLFGLYDGDLLIGSASLTKCFDLTGDCRDYYTMENFVIDKSHRRKGAGRMLLAFLEDYVASHDGRYINFTSSAARTESKAFYKACGYDADGVRGFKKLFPKPVTNPLQMLRVAVAAVRRRLPS